MRLSTRLDRLEQTVPRGELLREHTLSTRALEVSWQALERRSFAASPEIIEAVTAGLLARLDCDPAVKARVMTRVSREA